MSIEKFIEINYKWLVDYIVNAGTQPYMIDFDEIEMWVMNDEYLYASAIDQGVDI